MGEIVGAGLLSHVPTIVLPEAERRELNEGKEITLVTGLRQLRRDVFESDDYDTVVFLSTTGDVLNDAQLAAFEDYIQAGGGYTGIHAAADTEYGWAWYGGLVGGYFRNHPPGTPAATVQARGPRQSRRFRLPSGARR